MPYTGKHRSGTAPLIETFHRAVAHSSAIPGQVIVGIASAEVGYFEFRLTDDAASVLIGDLRVAATGRDA